MLDYGFYNMDCMEGMKQFPDKFFDLAIVDPPYGAGFTENGGCQGWFSKYHQTPENIGGGGTDSAEGSTDTRRIQRGGGMENKNITSAHYQRKNVRKPDGTWGYANWRTLGDEASKKIISWDVAPKQEYFKELFRVSRNQIIWGAITLNFRQQDALLSGEN